MPTPAQRLQEILGDDELTDKDTLTYTWDHGYEVVTVTHSGGGKLEYRGVFHPDGVCEGNPCHHCGKAFYE
jgi:hypothetical protein